MLEQGKELIKQEKYEEAYKYFSEHYMKYKDIESFYYMTNIDYFNFGKKSLKEYFDMYKFLYNKAPKKYLPAFVNQLATIAYDLKEYNFCKKLLKSAEKKNILDGYLYFLLASCVWYADKDLSLAEEYLSNVLNDEEVDDGILGAASELKAMIYAETYGYEKAMQVIQGMYVKLANKELIDFTELKVLFILKDDNLINEFLNKIIEVKSKDVASFCLNQVVEYYEKQENNQMLLLYTKRIVDEYLEFYTSKEFVYNYYLTILLNLEKYDELEEGLKRIDLAKCCIEQWSSVNYKYFSLYVHKKEYKKAEEIALLSYGKTSDQEWFFLLVDYYIYTNNFFEALRLLKEEVRNNKYIKDTNRINYNYLRIYRYTGKYDLAEEYGNRITDLNNSYALIKHKLAVAKNPRKLYKRFMELCFRIKTSVENYAIANMYLHGECNLKVNYELAMEYIDKAIDDDKNDHCLNSLLGNIYLIKGEYEKALNIFKKQYNIYKIGVDCPCSVVFYCYCMANGLGINENKNEAFNILDSIVRNNIGDINENGIGLYTDLGIELGKDLNEILGFVNNVHERRYSATIYYSKIKLKKILNIDYKDDYKMFRKSLKYVGSQERRYYKNNPKSIYLNNN